jgi:protein gp37
MNMRTPIEWTNATVNPVTGCDRISEGCRFCYLFRLYRMPLSTQSIPIELHPERWQEPLHHKRPMRIFVVDMGDLYHSTVPTPFILEGFEVMRRAHWHDFQLLTKRPGRAISIARRLPFPWPAHIWQGVSVESMDVYWRIDLLRQVPAAVRFLSCEPLLGPLHDLPLEGISWVIVGGESGGPVERYMRLEWARKVRDQCQDAGVPLFFKQSSGPRPSMGRLLDGRLWEEYPQPHPRERAGMGMESACVQAPLFVLGE